MQLVAASKAQTEDLRYIVRDVNAVKLFYVSAGRNAWWSTWITRYAEGCMHTTLGSARGYCESRRLQGTVFYVTELPSLAFIAEGRALVVSEINTVSLLSKFNQRRLAKITEILPVSTMTLDQMNYLFRSRSELWPLSYPLKDSAILTFCADPKTLQRISPTQKLWSWASRSAGGNAYLGWDLRPFIVKYSAVNRLAKALAERL